MRHTRETPYESLRAGRAADTAQSHRETVNVGTGDFRIYPFSGSWRRSQEDPAEVETVESVKLVKPVPRNIQSVRCAW
jgi:hypothetical protein